MTDDAPILALVKPDDPGQHLNAFPQTVNVDDKGWPDWFAELPIKAQQILALVSLGMSNNSIEKAFSLSNGVVDYYKKTYGKGRVLTLSPTNRNALQVAIVQSKAIQAASSITDADLDQAPLRDKAYAAKALAETAARLERGTGQAAQDTGDVERGIMSKLVRSSPPPLNPADSR